MKLIYIVTQSSDIINIINSILYTYQSVPNTKVNRTKSRCLKMNGWDVGLKCKLGISWNTKEHNLWVYFFFGGDMMLLQKY